MVPIAGTKFTPVGIIDDGNPGAASNADYFQVTLDASSFLNANPNVTFNRWILDGQSKSTQSTDTITVSRGIHTIGIVVLSGSQVFGDSTTVNFRDRLYVQLGDSLGAGEGNPDIPSPTNNGIGYAWQDNVCHRSGLSYGERTSAALQRAAPQKAVSFVSFACTGASSGDAAASVLECSQPGSSCSTRIRLNTEGGIMTPYRVTNGMVAQPAQLDSVQQALTATGSNRVIDDLVISIGGNDVNFSSIANDCAQPFTDCDQSQTIRSFISFATNEIGTSGGAIDRIAQALKDRNIHARRIWISTYYDPTTGNNGATCPSNSILADVPTGVFFIHPSISIDEASFISTALIGGVNQQIETGAQRNGWHVIGSSSSPLGTMQKRFSTHGYCSSVPFIRLAVEADNMQGPAGDPMHTKGVIHPNSAGTMVYADEATALLNSPGPTMSVANGILFLTDCDRGNGWLSGSQVWGAPGCRAGVNFTVSINGSPPHATSPNPVPPQAAGLLVSGPRLDDEGPEVIVDGRKLAFDRSNPNRWTCLPDQVLGCEFDISGAAADGRIYSASMILTVNAEGEHQYVVRAGNGVGVETTKAWIARADWTPPASTARLLPTITRRRSILLTAIDALSGVETIHTSLNGAAMADQSGNRTIAVKNGDILEYWAADRAGNLETHHQARLAGGVLQTLP